MYIVLVLDGFVRNFGTKKMVVCTKMVQWLAVIAVSMEVWYGLISGWMGIQLSRPVSEALIPLPLYTVMCFGCYSLATIGYRLMTFNDCNEAANELMEEIAEAKKDLSSKGIRT